MSIEKQIDEITMAVSRRQASRQGNRFTVKQMERTKKSLETQTGKAQ